MKKVIIIGDEYIKPLQYLRESIEEKLIFTPAIDKSHKSDIANLIKEEAKKIQEEPVLSGRENRRIKRQAQRREQQNKNRNKCYTENF